jgi:hypothetical protein
MTQAEKKYQLKGTFNLTGTATVAAPMLTTATQNGRENTFSKTR